METCDFPETMFNHNLKMCTVHMLMCKYLHYALENYQDIQFNTCFTGITKLPGQQRNICHNLICMVSVSIRARVMVM